MDYPRFVTANALDFLRGRGIALQMLDALAREQGFGDAQVLLTSSPVHGIATATSDVDLICVTPQPVSRGQMAAQIHRDGQHCEILPVAAGDLERAFADLAVLARRELPRRLAGYARWDAGHAVRRKYLERIVYAVATDGSAPHLAQLPALVPVAAAQDYDAFHQSRVCAVLAARAGEPGTARGYMVNACLAAMATALSLGGWVLSNKKWTLRRWSKAREPGMGVVDAALHAQLSALWESVAGMEVSMRELDALDAAGRSLASLVGAPPESAMPRTANLGTPAALDKRSAYLIGDDGRARLAPAADVQEPPADFAGLSTLDAASAAALLRAARSGALSFSLSAHADASAADHTEPADALAE